MCIEYLVVVDCLLGSEVMSTASYSPVGNIIFCCRWNNTKWVIYKWEDTLFRTIWELSFSVRLALSNYRQLKNISGVIPTYHDLDRILLIECIRDSRRQVVFWTDQEHVVRELQLMTEAGWFYLPRSQRSVQKACIWNCTSKFMCTQKVATSRFSSLQDSFYSRITFNWCRSQSSIVWIATVAIRADCFIVSDEAWDMFPPKWLTPANTMFWAHDNSHVAVDAHRRANTRITVRCELKRIIILAPGFLEGGMFAER
jgi:hypothetical protein